MEGKLDRVLELLSEHGDRLKALESWREEQAKKEVRVKAWIAGAVFVITVAIEVLRWLIIK
jgi:hypothetical protein